MKFEQFLNERDIALNKAEDCKDYKGEKMVRCKIKNYEDYVRDLEEAIKTSRSDDEKKGLEKSLEFAKKVLFKLRTTEKEMRNRR